MKYLLKSLLTVATFVLLLQSCVNRDYDFDNMDTTMVFRIPPLLLGNIETIYLGELPIGNLPQGIPLPPGPSIVKSYIFEGIFDDDVIDNFFFEGAGMVEIAARADVFLPISEATINLHFNVIGQDGEPIRNINIPTQRMWVGQNQDLSIRIYDRYMALMNNAQDLEIVLAISNQAGAVLIDGESYLRLNNVIIRTGGIRFDLFD